MKKFILFLTVLPLAVALACTLTVPGVTVNTDSHIYTTAADEALSRITDLATMPAPAAIAADGAKVKEWKP